MDLQRSLLIGAIAILSFMLLTEWVAFTDTKTVTVAQETSRLMSDDTKVSLALPEPNTNTVAPAEEEIPLAPAPEQPDPHAEAHAVAMAVAPVIGSPGEQQ